MLVQVVSGAATTGPFAALSLIVAPGILTNACSVLAMSTSNRLARAVDLARAIAHELEATPADSAGADTTRRLRELDAADRRSLLLLRSLSAVYTAMAGFATATLSSIIGVVFASEEGTVRYASEVAALLAGVVGVGGIVWAAVLLVRETRLAVATLRQRVRAQQARFGSRGPGPRDTF